jgi:hypothetical protein
MTNVEIEANRPKPIDTGLATYPAPIAKGQTSYEKGTIWQRGTQFFRQRDMNRLRLNQGIINSQAKRGERPLRPVNDGDVRLPNED